MYASPIYKNVVITECCLYRYILQNVKTLRKLCLSKVKHQKKLGLVRAQPWNLFSESSFSSCKSKCLVFRRYAGWAAWTAASCMDNGPWEWFYEPYSCLPLKLIYDSNHIWRLSSFCKLSAEVCLWKARVAVLRPPPVQNQRMCVNKIRYEYIQTLRFLFLQKVYLTQFTLLSSVELLVSKGTNSDWENNANLIWGDFCLFGVHTTRK